MTNMFEQPSIERYVRDGHWDGRTLAQMVAYHALVTPERAALIAPDAVLSWRQYDELSTRLAARYAEARWRRGEIVAVLMTGGAAVHVAYLAAQKAGLVTMGIGPRAGVSEIRHLLATSGARILVTRPEHRGRRAAELVQDLDVDLHVTLHMDGPQCTVTAGGANWELPTAQTAEAMLEGRSLGANDLFFLNSTSGSTGLPKCVMQTMNTRKFFGPLAAEAAELGPDEVFMSAVPAPYGFGQWSGHVVPAMYGYTTVLTDEFDAAETLRLIGEHRVTVLAAVTSQFIMLLNSPAFPQADLSSLRVMFTGGEKVPFARAAEFEERTGCSVLQFYGSNEAGPLSVTSVHDDRPRRLGTAGRVIPSMNVRLWAVEEVPGREPEPARDVTATGGPGQCGALGPGLSPGYFNDAEANARLFRPDGWMLTGDIVTIDADGYLSVTGRASDFIIRGGHNISALAVEEAVASCPRVMQVAVVGRPDEVLGERVCAFVTTSDRQELSLEELRDHLAGLGFSKHAWPEWVITMPVLPQGTGAKVDKGALRALLSRPLS